jgi:putative ABC transport system permease protein
MIEAGWRRLRRVWRPSVRDEVGDELAFHLEMRIAEYEAAGFAPADAAAKARAQFGDVAAVSERLVRLGARRRRRFDVLERADALLLDTRFAARTLRKHWPSSIAAIGILSLATAAAVTTFAVVDTVLLRPLPFPDAAHLYTISADVAARHLTRSTMSGGDLPDVRSGGTTFASIAAIGGGPNTPYSIDGGVPEPLYHSFTTTNIFDVLGTPVSLGRNFIADDGGVDAPRGRHRVAIIGYDFWQRRYHGDETVVGRIITGPWGPTRIIGVASPRARLLLPNGAHTEPSPDVWEPRLANFAALPHTGGGWHFLGRLRPGATLAAARAQMDSVSAVLGDRYPESHNRLGVSFHVDPLHDVLVRQVRPVLLALMSAAGLLLLIACANVGSLLLVRAAARERELAVRVAIGGTRRRIIAQLLTESGLLAATASTIGLVLAAVAIVPLRQITTVDLPRAAELSIDARVLGFALGITVLSTLLGGSIPAGRAARADASHSLRARLGVHGVGGASRLRTWIVVGEVTLSFALLVGCGLMLRSFVTLSRSRLGFDPRGVLTFTLSNRNFTSAADRLAYVDAVRARIAAVPGVEGVTLSTGLPFGNAGSTKSWGTADMLRDSARVVGQADLRAVTPGYFELLRIPLVAGRVFTPGQDSVDRRQVIIDDAAAAAAFGSAPPIGQTIVTQILDHGNEPFTVVGVVRRERHNSLVGADRPMIYFPWATGALQAGQWAVRTRGDPFALAPTIRAAIESLPIPYASNTRAGSADARRLIVNDMQPLNAFVDRELAPTRFMLMLLGGFAGVAALLAALGLYSVLSSAVRQRTAEIGVRMAFGADSRDIFALVVGHGLRLSIAGLALGVAFAWMLARRMAGLLVGVRPTDPVTFGATIVVFLGIALLACWLPARRASSLDPSIALREDAA